MQSNNQIYRQFHNKWQSLTVTDKQAGGADYSTDQKNFTDHMFNIKLEEKSYKMSFRILPLKIQRSKNRQGAQCDEVFREKKWRLKVVACFYKENPSASQHLLVPNQQWKHQNNVWNLFKVNNKDTRTTSMKSFRCLYC